MKQRWQLNPRVEKTRSKHPSRLSAPTLTSIKQRFDANLSQIESHFAVADRLVEQQMPESAQDILRSQIVFLESALDHYVHELFRYGLAHMFNREWPPTAAFDEMDIDLGDVLTILREPERKNAVFERYIEEQNAFQSFMKYRAIDKQLDLIGLSMERVTEEMEIVMGEPVTKKKLENELDKIADRRNQIVHRTDRKQRSDARRESIDSSYVKRCIHWIASLVEAMHRSAARRS